MARTQKPLRLELTMSQHQAAPSLNKPLPTKKNQTIQTKPTQTIQNKAKQTIQSVPRSPSKVVLFPPGQESEKKREKFLTAKYGTHQMALIRKRLRVEMWMFDQLQMLYAEEETEPEVDI